MIKKGETIEGLSSFVIYPLFLEDEAVYSCLPRWNDSNSRGLPMRAISDCGSETMTAFVKHELLKSNPDHVAVMCLRMVSSDTLPDCCSKESIDDDNNAASSQVSIKAWRLVSSQIELESWKCLYQLVSRQLYTFSVDHPLHAYASHIVPSLTEKERHQVATILGIKHHRSSVLGLIKQIQDTCPAVQLYGLVVKYPLTYQLSCLPTATIQWNPVVQAPVITAQYDLVDKQDVTICLVNDDDSLEDRVRAIEKRTGESCACDRCRYEMNPDMTLGIPDKLSLARFYLSKGDLELARDLYSQVLKLQSDHLDSWHARGAIELSLGRKCFLKAQRLWADAVNKHPKSCLRHPGLSLQAEKLRAYQYLDRDTTGSIGPSCDVVVSPFHELLPDVYCSHVLDGSICERILAWAKQSKNWTQNRHYAVPTYDVPVHCVPKLLEWFHPWLLNQVRPLLAQQFATTANYYVHDAFVVQYDAATTGSSDTLPNNYLPLHTDESTHSFVLALNHCNDYGGGGTYFYDQDVTYRAKMGEMVSFRGDSVLHGGEAVWKGTRYVLAVFLYHDDDDDKVESCKMLDTREREREKESFNQVLQSSKEQKLEFSFKFMP